MRDASHFPSRAVMLRALVPLPTLNRSIPSEAAHACPCCSPRHRQRLLGAHSCWKSCTSREHSRLIRCSNLSTLPPSRSLRKMPPAWHESFLSLPVLQPVGSAASVQQLLRVYDCGVFTAASMVTLVALVMHSANGIGWLPTSSIGSPVSPLLARVRWHVWRRHLYPCAHGSQYVQRTSNLLACGQPGSAASAQRLPLVHTCVALTTTSTVALVALVMHSANGICWLAASSIGPDRQPCVRWCVLRHHRCCHVRGHHLAQRASNTLAHGQFDRCRLRYVFSQYRLRLCRGVGRFLNFGRLAHSTPLAGPLSQIVLLRAWPSLNVMLAAIYTLRERGVLFTATSVAALVTLTVRGAHRIHRLSQALSADSAISHSGLSSFAACFGFVSDLWLADRSVGSLVSSPLLCVR